MEAKRQALAVCSGHVTIFLIHGDTEHASSSHVLLIPMITGPYGKCMGNCLALQSWVSKTGVSEKFVTNCAMYNKPVDITISLLEYCYG